ncbi:CheW protein [Geothermobacter ehrlichii]|uniref:CheW protein n=1 Tax=Geothermobacter ehrlichii TaxID=213224 RepID=A0A5D3WMB7_9BACT|nr:chemotaxis protein CheW [Geothermobacter ehrlichii]TYP00133.1 CheW protein [Geothermobacter ehrlichii]
MHRDQSEERHTGGRVEVQLACFRVGHLYYGLDIMRIREVIRPMKITPIPKSPAFVEGVINLRGAVIPVVDMRRRFDLEIPPDGRKTRIMICAVSGRVIGLKVDEVAEVRSYGRGDIQPAPHYIKGPEAEFFLGVCRRDDDLVMILDLEKILSSEEKIDLETLGAEAESTV